MTEQGRDGRRKSYLLRHGRLRKITAAVVIVLASGWPVWLEVGDDLAEFFSKTAHCDYQQHDAPASFDFDSLYRKIFRFYPHQPRTDEVVVLTMSSDLGAVMSNVCAGRAFTADMLDALAGLRPAAVALDKYYSPNGCDPASPSTQRLQASVDRFPVPLVVGESAADTTTDDKYSCLCQQKGLPFRGPEVRSGLITLNEDVLQIPLRWAVRWADRPQRRHTDADYMPQAASYGLAFATAVAVRPQLQHKLARLLSVSTIEDPYANLWGAEELEHVDAADFLCATNSEAARQRWGLACANGATVPEMTGRVVVVGAADVSDRKLLLGENLSGHEIHARYIAALLGDSYLREWPLLLRLGTAFLLVGFTEGLVLSLDVDKRAWSWRQLLNLSAHDQKTGWPVIWIVTALCVAFLLVGGLSMYAGFLPPIALMATAVLLLVNDWRSYLVVRWIDRNRRLALEAKSEDRVSDAVVPMPGELRADTPAAPAIRA